MHLCYNTPNRINNERGSASNTAAPFVQRKGKFRMASSDITTFDSATEEWRDVPGYEGLYQVSTFGSVKTFSYNRPRLLKTKINRRSGYVYVILCNKGRSATFSLHRLVMLCFGGERPEGWQINHKNGVKTDNRLENLEYVTPRENILHSIDVLGAKPGNRTTGRGYKLSNDDVHAIKSRLDAGDTLNDIAVSFGVKRQTIKKIVDKKLHADALSPEQMANMLTTDQAAELLGYSKSAITRAIDDGNLKAIRSGRRWWVLQEDFDAYRKTRRKMRRNGTLR